MEYTVVSVGTYLSIALLGQLIVNPSSSESIAKISQALWEYRAFISCFLAGVIGIVQYKLQVELKPNVSILLTCGATLNKIRGRLVAELLSIVTFSFLAGTLLSYRTGLPLDLNIRTYIAAIITSVGLLLGLTSQ